MSREQSIDETERFPEDAPEDFANLVSREYDEHEFHRLHRNVAGKPIGGATWRSDDEEVKVMNYAAWGYWAVEASRIEHDEDNGHAVIYANSNGAVDGLAREEAFRLADSSMTGEAELANNGHSEPRSGQQTLDEVMANGGQSSTRNR